MATETLSQRIDRGFAFAVRTIWHLLPRPIRTRVPMSFVGFALINGFTFSVDIALLSLLYRGVGLPHPLAITIGYVVAFGLAFVLNRRFNFHAHGPVAGRGAMGLRRRRQLRRTGARHGQRAGHDRGALPARAGWSRRARRRSGCTPRCAGGCSPRGAHSGTSRTDTFEALPWDAGRG
ncbi:GtrA family protein [Nocardioides sp. B-3]|uniref:GtrA family protein n=1 Tax=Nocardioides sp. B-3 TaxID=2895565 RepID=UPI0021523C12|nr:GtrA family protein [Nocardioides sp. B-3]UUZ59154.1 GtrA family protein [Nocardioides sp. B-3]